MRPAFSLIFFTTLTGAAQGLVCALALAALLGPGPAGLLAPAFARSALALAGALLAAGLAASFLHLGHKLRAWRAVLMWRSSWMAREVIVVPLFIALVGLWWLALRLGAGAPWHWLLPALLLGLACALWYCTAMIYACLRFVQEWAHALTVVCFALIGLASGLVLACALAALAGAAQLLALWGPCALGATLAAWAARALALRRNAGLRPRSSAQSATGIGIPGAALVQTAMGMSAGSFNTREFFHRAPAAVFAAVRVGFVLSAFALPALLLGWALAAGAGAGARWPWLLALLVQAPGLLAERWFFYAQARHPQNLYYQTVS